MNSLESDPLCPSRWGNVHEPMAVPWIYLPGFGIRVRFCVGALLRVRPVFSIPRQGIHNLAPGNALSMPHNFAGHRW